MNRLLAVAECLLILCVPCIAGNDTYFTTPVIVVTPVTLDFGRVTVGTTVTNTLLMENIGRGKLVGKATVAAPFKILSGASYSVRENEAQIITVTYKPTGTAPDEQTISFSGGGGARVTLTGKPKPAPPKRLMRK